jgi:Mg-chelatase subunit ChlD
MNVRSILVVALACCMVTIETSSASPTIQTKVATTNKNANTSNSSGTKLFGRVDEVDFALRAAGVMVGKDKLIEAVRMGSPAYYAGVAENDKIISGEITNRDLNLIISRAGKIFSVKLAVQPRDLSRAIPRLDAPVTVSSSANAADTPADKHDAINKYDVVIFIDASGSMNDEIAGEKVITKWSWCEQFVSPFAKGARQKLGNRGLTLVSFNGSHSIARSQTPEQVANFFRTTQADGATNLGSPLYEVLQGHLRDPKRRPLLVVILTDGMPNCGPKVEGVIADATQALESEQDVRIAFLEVGDNGLSSAYLKYLDGYLQNDGAKFDVVDTLTFEQLKKSSFLDVLFKLITIKPNKVAGQHIQIDIDKLKAEMEMLRSKPTENLKER